MKIKDFLIFTVLLVASNLFILCVHDLSHKYDDPPVSETAYDEAFELGKRVPAPWGADMFCKENPEKCGMN